MKKIVRYFINIIIVLVLIGIILGFSTQDAARSAGLSLTITEKIQEITLHINGAPERTDAQIEYLVRKFAHFLEYMFLALVVLITFRNLTKKFYIWLPLTIIVTSPIPVIDEFFVQVMSPGRTPMITDVGIDWLGITVAIIMFCAIHFSIYISKDER